MKMGRLTVDGSPQVLSSPPGAGPGKEFPVSSGAGKKAPNSPSRFSARDSRNFRSQHIPASSRQSLRVMPNFFNDLRPRGHISSPRS